MAMGFIMKWIAIIGLAVFLSGAAQASWGQSFLSGYSNGATSWNSGEIAGMATRQVVEKVVEKTIEIGVRRLLERETPQSPSVSRVSTGVSAPTSGETKESGTIERLLKSADLKYTVDKDGDYWLTFNCGDGRDQVIWIFARTEKLDECEFVRLASLAYHGTVTKQMVLELQSDVYTVGSWHIQKDENDEGKYFIGFRASIPKAISSVDFRSCCWAIVRAADALEKKWTGADNF